MRIKRISHTQYLGQSWHSINVSFRLSHGISPAISYRNTSYLVQVKTVPPAAGSWAGCAFLPLHGSGWNVTVAVSSPPDAGNRKRSLGPSPCWVLCWAWGITRFPLFTAAPDSEREAPCPDHATRGRRPGFDSKSHAAAWAPGVSHPTRLSPRCPRW